MLVKRSRKNQVAIPKAILERAGLSEEDQYFDMMYHAGRIILTPVQLEEKIPPEALARFEAKALKREPGDRVYQSTAELIEDLHRIRRRGNHG
jgi:bifunctional DNA-binding transcriptional regulator/antitoxin component of YhaV-PrlF toxin-antitoxin module